MTDITFALEAKSDQLNAVDLIAGDRTIKIMRVDVKRSDQPVSIYFEGDHGKPWKPSKGMLRVLAMAWGSDSINWVGRHATLYNEPTVIYGGKQIGGIRIRAMSDIDKKGLTLSLAISRSKREPYKVSHLEVSAAMYPDDHFQKALPTMIRHMQEGTATLQGIIAQCQKTGQLTRKQMNKLEAGAPIVSMKECINSAFEEVEQSWLL